MKKVFGVLVAISFVLAVCFPGTGGAVVSDDTAKCQAKKVNASTIFVKKLFYAYASELKDPDGFDFDAVVTEAETQFQDRWDAAEASDDCDFPFGQNIDTSKAPVNFPDLGELINWIETQVDAIAGLITFGIIDDQNKDLVNLGAELLRATGQKAFSLLKAEAQNLQNPNDAKRTQARVKAMNKYGSTYEKRVQKAEKKGVDVSYYEDDSDLDGTVDILDETEAGIDTLVQDIVTVFTAEVVGP